MKKLNYSIAIILTCLTLALFTSCEKENISEETEIPNSNNPSVNLCVGDGTTNPLPLKVGNRWYLKKKLGGWNDEIKVSKKVIKNGVEYFQVDTDNVFGKVEKFLRVDSNGDIYELAELSTGDREYLLVPRNPTNAQQWAYYGLINNETYIRKIRLVSVTENSFLAIKMGECTLTKYIIVDNIKVNSNGSETIISSTFFAPGVGYIGNGTYNLLSELKLN